MKIIRKIVELRQFVDQCRNAGQSIGLVPTMGALHEGHLSLMHLARKNNDIVVASVFVNPTQFNNPDDLATYPRCEQKDAELLQSAGVDVMFAPSVEEVYPPSQKDELRHVFDLGEVAEVMEGKFRPGHFQGVALIVSKLFRMVNPNRAYFGEKDFQQIAVIRRMAQTEHIDIEIVSCPICRADDGLALSSRNALLTPEQRDIAPGIYATLKKSVQLSQKFSVSEVHNMVVDAINSLPECRVEYFQIVDGISLQPIKHWSDSEYIVGCITVYCGKVRLIDNIAYRKPKQTN